MFEVEREIRCLPEQAEMIAYDRMWGAARGGQRAGKSVGFSFWLFVKRIQPYPFANHVVVGADYEQLRRGYFDLMIGFLDSLGWEEGVDYKYREHGRPKITFTRFGTSGGRECVLQSLSTKLVERIRGQSIQTLLLEEPQTWGTKAISGEKLFGILVGRLSHSVDSQIRYPDLQPQGRMSFNPPPEGHWLYNLIENNWKKDGYKCWKMSVRKNWLLERREEYVGNLVANLPPDRHASEIDGEWATAGGSTYYCFNSITHGNPPAGIPAVDWVDPSRPIAWTHDFNVHKMCSTIAQDWDNDTVPTWQPKILRALDEFIVRDAGAPQVVEAFLASPWYEIALEQGLELYGDPSGGARSQTADARGSARTMWEIIVSGLRNAGIEPIVKVTRAHPTIKNRVNEVNAQFITGAGPGMTINLEKCPDLSLDFRTVAWADNGYDLDKTDKERSHSSDNWGYYAYVKRRPIPQASFAVAKTRR